MNGGQKLLLPVIAVEALAWSVVKFRPASRGPVPEVRKEAIDPTTAQEITALEITLRPDEPTDWIRLGRVYRAFNLMAAAEACFRAADRSAPTGTGHLYDWAVTLSRSGRTREAAVVAERAIAAGVPEANELRLMRARDCLREDDVPAAEQRLRELSQEPDAMLMLARVLVRTGRAREARTLLDRWLAGAPDDFRARQMRAWVAETLGNAEEARRHRELGLRSRDWGHRRDPVSIHDHQLRQEFARGKILARVQALETAGKWTEAAEALGQAQAIAWMDEDAARLAGQELRAGQPRRAVAELERLIELGGASGEHLLSLAQAWQAAGDLDKAWGDAHRADRLGANQSAMGNVQVHQFLASLAAARGDTTSAQFHQGRAQYALAKQSWLENDVAQAHQQFQRAAALDPAHAHAWFYLGETSALMGNLTLARQSYTRCLALAPHHGRAQAALERLR